MRWWHAAIIAAGLVVGGALSGGIYTYARSGDSHVRFNRFTGALDVYGSGAGQGQIGWRRLPNRVEWRVVEEDRRARGNDEDDPSVRRSVARRADLGGRCSRRRSLAVSLRSR